MFMKTATMPENALTICVTAKMRNVNAPTAKSSSNKLSTNSGKTKSTTDTGKEYTKISRVEYCTTLLSSTRLSDQNNSDIFGIAMVFRAPITKLVITESFSAITKTPTS